MTDIPKRVVSFPGNVSATPDGTAAGNGNAAGNAETPKFESHRFRMLLVSLLAAVIGGIAGVIAYLLYNLIGLFTNLFFYHRWSFAFVSPMDTPLRWWIIVTPVIGGVIVGIMAKYGSRKIRGHGIRKRWKRCCSVAAASSRRSPS